MVHSDIKRIYRMKCKLQHLKNTLGGSFLMNCDLKAKEHIEKAIEELHTAELLLRQWE